LTHSIGSENSNTKVNKEASKERVAGSAFQFVNIVEPKDLVDPKTKTFVRKQVWKNRKKSSPPITFRPLLSKADGTSTSLVEDAPKTPKPGSKARENVRPSPQTLVRNDKVDVAVYVPVHPYTLIMQS
jgi:hypothetical protein